MERDYDLFEVLPDDASIWKETVSGHENAIQKFKKLSKRTSNEVRVMHVLSNTLIASMKGLKAQRRRVAHKERAWLPSFVRGTPRSGPRSL
jgi:hypothetical protein